MFWRIDCSDEVWIENCNQSSLNYNFNTAKEIAMFWRIDCSDEMWIENCNKWSLNYNYDTAKEIAIDWDNTCFGAVVSLSNNSVLWMLFINWDSRNVGDY